MSTNPISFRWKQIVEPHIIQVEPSYGEISPKSYAIMDVLITGVKPGKLIDDLACYIEYADEPVNLHVEAQIKGPEGVIQEANVDFGLVKLGETARSYVTLENISNLQLNWKLKCLENQEFFEFVPNGSLIPLETGRIEIFFRPKEELYLNTQFEIEIEMGKTLVFNCFGHAQRPAASFLHSEIHLDHLFLNIEHEFTYKLCNHSMLRADFVWGQPQGKNAKNCEIVFDYDSSNGVSLDQKSTLEGTIRITCNELGPIDDLRIPCYVKDMKYPIFLSIHGLVKGVSVEFEVSDNSNHEKSSNSEIINFGEIKCGESTEKRLIIKNTSAIPTRAWLRFDRFQLIHEEDKITLKPKRSTMKISDKYRLKDAISGIGFACERGEDDSPIELVAFGRVSVAMYALTELWGEYEDTLIVEVEGIQYRLPVRCQVEGAPVRIYTGRVVDEDERGRGIEIPVVRFGSLMQGAGRESTHVRKLQIQNISRVPIEIEWHTFNVEPSDRQLIDLNLIYPEINEAEPGTSYSSSLDDEKRLSRNESSASLKEKISPIREVKYSNEQQASSPDIYDSNYIQNKYFPIVRVNLGTHFGRQTDENDQERVFSLNEYNSILKPRERTAISISFNSNVKSCQNFEATFIGYLRLAQNFIEGPGFKRKIGFECDPIRFKATGKLESPNLVVEFDNEDLMFRTAIGDLIRIDDFKNRNNFMSTEKTYKNRFSLYNNSLAAIEFKLVANSPFSITDNSNDSKYVIKPKSKLKVLFKMDTSLIKKLHFPSEPNQRMALIHEHIRINYADDMYQNINMGAKIFAPEFIIRPEKIEFGMCLIGQERCQQVIIKNPSFSSIVWSLSIENDMEGAFRCDVNRGILEADKDFVNKNEQLVNVFFTARSNKVYASSLVITAQPSVLGKEQYFIELNGHGTIDQKHEAVFNV